MYPNIDVRYYVQDDLLKYDKEQALFGKISKEKALYISWQSAYTNKLVNEEIELLQKLIDFVALIFIALIFIPNADI